MNSWFRIILHPVCMCLLVAGTILGIDAAASPDQAASAGTLPPGRPFTTRRKKCTRRVSSC